jgi:hypothetical protein
LTAMSRPTPPPSPSATATGGGLDAGCAEVAAWPGAWPAVSPRSCGHGGKGRLGGWRKEGEDKVGPHWHMGPTDK